MPSSHEPFHYERPAYPFLTHGPRLPRESMVGIAGGHTPEAIRALGSVAWTFGKRPDRETGEVPPDQTWLVECWDDEDARARIEKVATLFGLRIKSVEGAYFAVGGFFAQPAGTEIFRIGFRGVLTPKVSHAIAGLGFYPHRRTDGRRSSAPSVAPEDWFFECYALSVRDAERKAARALVPSGIRPSSVELAPEPNAEDFEEYLDY